MTAEVQKPSDLHECLGRCVETLQRWELDARRGEVRSEAKPYYANGMFAGDLRDMGELLVRAQGEIVEQMLAEPTTPTPIPHMPNTTLPRPVEEALEHLSQIAQFAYENGFHELGYNPVDVVREQFAKMAAEPVRIVTPFANMVAMAVRQPAWPEDENQRVLVHGEDVDFGDGKFGIVKTIDLLEGSRSLKCVTHWLVLRNPSSDGDAGVPVGSNWKHSGGDVYTVIGHTNLNSSQPERYPPSIVYVGSDGHVWSRAVADWSRSMTAQGDAQ